MSYADGLCQAFELAGQDRAVVAVVGDGALTGGLPWEALNNLGGCERQVVIVWNDNGRYYALTVGGIASHLGRLRDRPGYAGLVATLGGTPAPPTADPVSVSRRWDWTTSARWTARTSEPCTWR